MSKRGRGRSAGAFWDQWIWTQDDDHPQKWMAQPMHRVRRWLRGKTEADRAAATRWSMAPARAVKMIFDGLRRRVVL